MSGILHTHIVLFHAMTLGCKIGTETCIILYCGMFDYARFMERKTRCPTVCDSAITKKSKEVCFLYRYCSQQIDWKIIPPTGIL